MCGKRAARILGRSDVRRNETVGRQVGVDCARFDGNIEVCVCPILTGNR